MLDRTYNAKTARCFAVTVSFTQEELKHVRMLAEEFTETPSRFCFETLREAFENQGYGFEK